MLLVVEAPVLQTPQDRRKEVIAWLAWSRACIISDSERVYNLPAILALAMPGCRTCGERAQRASGTLSLR